MSSTPATPTILGRLNAPTGTGSPREHGNGHAGETEKWTGFAGPVRVLRDVTKDFPRARVYSD
jgi:hypothetical protein